jgi:hypothetical protein
MSDGTTDPAAIAASTAQGWAHALNTVARPAPEHLEAAQEALTALQRADRAGSALGVRTPQWSGVTAALETALVAARLRVDGRPAITVDQLLEALDRLQERGLEVTAQRPALPDPALVQAVQEDGLADRIAELEQELEQEQDETAQLEEKLDAAREAVALTEADARRQSELRDRFEREADQARRESKAAHAGHSAAIAAAREDSRRAGYLWTLNQLGNNLPGYAQMPAEELREAATKRLGEVLLESGQLRHGTRTSRSRWRPPSSSWPSGPRTRAPPRSPGSGNWRTSWPSWPPRGRPSWPRCAPSGTCWRRRATRRPPRCASSGRSWTPPPRRRTRPRPSGTAGPAPRWS